ncbi:MAG TPA: hypothetical protein VL551_34015 [Actinospica sp.]|jgi:hypothetical protein|nr:hypothetical protein [Actinospica sp.]
MTHRPAGRFGRARRGRHRKPRPSLRKLICDRLVDRTPARSRPAREITLRVRRIEQQRRIGGGDA